ncbi:predicted protein [Lichtheimia corymbifera JMRC:FSU:9682]|uniref:Uncharacterized protein n=1 Tax=Lichtheimia corymbifera JMRC:FSU:9682 TaxID=1263082 RepID=A0A068S5Q7_9FUNG|nr:predicted protein [Lichtheimia corymbifera JMRC:FSU:9682]
MNSEEKDMITVQYRSEHTGHVAGSNNDMISLPQEQAGPGEDEEETPSADDLLQQETAFIDAFERLNAEVEKIMQGKYSVPAHVLNDLADRIDSMTNKLKRWNEGDVPS